MNKKAAVLFFIFAILLIGGSLVLSIWIIPYFFNPYHVDGGAFGRAGMIERAPDTERPPRTEMDSRQMAVQLAIACLTVFLLLLAGKRLKNRYSKPKQLNIQKYFSQISGLAGKSEYDIFRKAAQDWQVTPNRIERDFDRYMSTEHMPYYVIDFVRKNASHVDQVSPSLFARRRTRD